MNRLMAIGPTTVWIRQYIYYINIYTPDLCKSYGILLIEYSDSDSELFKTNTLLFHAVNMAPNSDMFLAHLSISMQL